MACCNEPVMYWYLARMAYAVVWHGIGCGGGAQYSMWWWCTVVVYGGSVRWWWCAVVVHGGGTTARRVRDSKSCTAHAGWRERHGGLLRQGWRERRGLLGRVGGKRAGRAASAEARLDAPEPSTAPEQHGAVVRGDGFSRQHERNGVI